MTIEHVSIQTDGGQITVRLATNQQEFEATGENLSDALSALAENLADEGL